MGRCKPTFSFCVWSINQLLIDRVELLYHFLEFNGVVCAFFGIVPGNGTPELACQVVNKL